MSTTDLTPLEQRLCGFLQDGLPICPRPSAAVAEALGITELSALAQTAALRRQGIIRRLGPIIDYRALGRVTTLVTAHVSDDAVEKVAAAVSALAGVSHNYLRSHHYNLWFTLQADSDAALDATLAKLSADSGVTFYSLPAVRFFKLDVRFGPSSGIARSPRNASSASPVVLSDADKAALRFLQTGVEMIPRPFAALADDDHILETVKSLVARGVIKRIAATLDYRALGFTANAMFCCEVPVEKVEECGKALASLEMVSHCYERRIFPGWPCNLFAMMHARDAADIDRAVSQFAADHAVTEFALLPTLREFKKSPVTLPL
jgi:siroheme decarboxylase